MKAQKLDLNSSVGTSYDQTRTTLVGRASQKTISGKQVVGTPLSTFADVITDANLTPLHLCVTDNDRAFIVNAPSAGVGTIALYNFNSTTGGWTYVGKLAYNVPNSPATTHTLRVVRAADPGTTGWKIFIGTVGTVTANGGLFMLNNVALSDFVPVGFATLPAATAAGQKAVYFLQETGGTNLLTAMQGFEIDTATSKIYVGNNTAATFQGYIFDYSLTINTVGAGGVTSDMFVLKTGTLPGMIATTLLLNNFNLVTPTTGINAGQLCISIPSSTAFQRGKVSEWTNGATSWPSLENVNVLDVANINVSLTPLTAHYSQILDRCIFQSSTGRWVVKQFVNNSYELVFGNPSDSQYRTAQSVAFHEWGAFTITGSFVKNGWLFQSSSTVGQIGILAFDLRSADIFDYSYVVSKVIDVPNSQWTTLRFTAPVRSFAKVYYRTSGFGSLSGGWTAAPLDGDYSGIATSGTQIQFKIHPRFDRDGSTIPLQMIDAFFVYQPQTEISDNWVGSVDNTTDSTQTPSRTAFRLIKAYTSSAPKLYFRAYDDNGILVASANTIDNPSLFEYSTNNGSSWNSLGTIPNVVSTTELRYNWASPPGVKVTCSIREA